MLKLTDCTKEEQGKLFTRTEEGKSFCLQSDKDLICNILSIDKCFLKGSGIKSCDWLFTVPKEERTKAKPKAFYVELKGNDMRLACEQLYNGIDKTKANFPNFDFNALIISTKGGQPEIRNREHYKKVKRLIRKEIQFHKVHKGNNFTHIEKV